MERVSQHADAAVLVQRVGDHEEPPVRVPGVLLGGAHLRLAELDLAAIT
jgi:hypothetical protein